LKKFITSQSDKLTP